MPPFKSVSVPPNPSARRGQKVRAAQNAARAAAPAEAPPPELAAPVAPRPPRPVQAPPHHRYRAGERLRMTPGGNTLARAGADCRVIALLPYEGYGALLYRVRSDAESFERVIAEADLSRR